MQTMIKKSKTFVIMLTLAAFVPAFGMENNQPNQQQNQQNQQNRQVCDICGKNDTPIRTMSQNKTETINNGRWVHTNNYNNGYQPKYKNKPCKKCYNNYCYCYEPTNTYSYSYVPQYSYNNKQCFHTVCTHCIIKSTALTPDNNDCKLCPYITARVQHNHCAINGCAQPVEHILQKTAHTHGLCDNHYANDAIKVKHKTQCNVCYINTNPTVSQQHPQCESCQNNTFHVNVADTCTHHVCADHNNKALNFKHSPVDYIKDTFQGNGCTACFIKDNPSVISCETRARYWGEMALITGAASVVAYGVYKVYTWWEDRKEKQAQAEKCDCETASEEVCEAPAQPKQAPVKAKSAPAGKRKPRNS